MTTSTSVISSPVGPLQLTWGKGGLSEIRFLRSAKRKNEHSPNGLREAEHALKKYFDGERLPGALPIDCTGTTFQKKIWHELMKVKSGSTITYGELAKRAGYPGAARAVGSAMKKNPLPIIIPCHRVLPRNGTREKPGYYGGGVKRKLWLLEHEKKLQ